MLFPGPQPAYGCQSSGYLKTAANCGNNPASSPQPHWMPISLFFGRAVHRTPECGRRLFSCRGTSNPIQDHPNPLSPKRHFNLIKPSSAPSATNQSIPTNTPYYATQPPHTGSTKTVPKSNYKTTIPYGPATLTLNPPSQHNTQTIQHQPSPTLHYT